MIKSFTFALAMLCASAFCADAPFTVKEYAGKARTNEPVSCGIAFKKGEVTSLNQLSLFSGGTEIPAQFSKLVRFEDGSYQWALCDFTDNFAGNEEKSYTVKKQAPSALASPGVTVTRSGSVVTVNNGVVSFAIDTVNFKGIQSLVSGGTTYANGTTGGLYIRDEIGDTTCWNGPSPVRPRRRRPKGQLPLPGLRRKRPG